MNLKFNYYWLLLLVPLLFLTWFFKSKGEDRPLRYLAFYGPKKVEKIKDTAYHTLPAFEFVNQFNEQTNLSTISNKIVVVEYFFTTCKSICPIMNANLEKVYKAFYNRSDFLILSHTVDPETDSVPVLKMYADQHGVNNRNWLFLTGKKKQLYDLARKGYLLNAEEGNGGEEDFIHTQNFALLDKERHLRGFYDGTDSLEIVRLIAEIKLLIQEYEYKGHHLQ